jgi:uncharacterized protein YdiU (UPF0061 family)
MKLEALSLNNPYLQLPALCHDRAQPSPLHKPYLIHANPKLAKELKIDLEELSRPELVELVNGTWAPEGSVPFAMCYAGHQFGYFVQRLGDGRAINIGTLATPDGSYHLQLKGAGQTKYSRDGDGRAVIRSSIREYLMSEAMHGLGIPTSRALAVIGSEHSVYREDWERGAIVLRVAPSWVRFGTFEYFAHHRKYEELKALAEYTIAESYPHLAGKPDCYQRLYAEVILRTAELMAQWQAVGFSHGVMNTDNMSIAGLTIDYGPYAFLDDYDHDYICNHTDAYGRYSFGNQPAIGHWNLKALMQAFAPLSDEVELVRLLEHTYAKHYTEHYLDLMSRKLGLDRFEPEDSELIRHLLGMMQGLGIDYTLFFRLLSRYDGDRTELLRLGFYHQPMHDWLDLYDVRLTRNICDTPTRHDRMLRTNPKYVLKNYIIQEAIEAAQQGNHEIVSWLFDLAHDPYDEHPKFERWAGATPEQYKNRKLSCSS